MKNSDRIIYRNRKYWISIRFSDDTGGCSYKVYYSWKKIIVGVIDKSLESIDDYIESLFIFNKNRKFGKSAKRWLNRNLKPIFEKFNYNTEILFNSKPIKCSSLSENESYEEELKYINSVRIKLGVKGFLD